MYSKFLFVGLGGSGGKTLRFLKREVTRWMASHDASARLPSGWQFLHIDTPVVADGDEIDELAPRLGSDEYFGLIGAGMDFRALQNILDGDRSLHPELQTWRVEPAGLNVGVQLGAGQMRAVGQSVAMAYALQIRQRLEERVRRMTGPSSRAELGELYHRVVGQSPESESNMYIVVVSSLAGGTGAGLLNLVCDILRALDTPAGDNIFGILYTPEVFHSLGGASIGGVYPNSLAALCEMLNGAWWQGSETDTSGLAAPKESAVLRGAGLPSAQERSGPNYPFLVGRVGAGGIDYGTPDRLFEMTGRSLLSWMTDRAVQARFVAYTAGNWANSALAQPQGDILVDQGETHERGVPCLSALGFSRLSVGAEHLERYAWQRITKDTLSHLTRYHSDSDEATAVRRELESDDPDLILRSIADRHCSTFWRATRLTEVGPDENEIVDDLLPTDHESLASEFERRAMELAGLEEDSRPVEASRWRVAITEAIREAQQEFERKYRAGLEAATHRWITAASERIVDAAEAAVAERGLLVASEICAMTASYLREDVYRDLTEEDLPRFRRWSQGWQTAVDEDLDGLRGKVRSDDVRLGDAVRRGVDYAVWAGNALVAERAGQLSRETAERVLEPLRKALLDAHSVAEADANQTVTWVGWDDEPPPDSARPPAGDFPLIDPDAYPEIFADLLARDIGGASRPLEQREEVRRLVISGSFRDSTPSQMHANRLRCVEVTRDWWPSTAITVGGSHSPAVLRARIRTSLDELRDRAREWLRRPGSAWERQLSMTIRGFVGTSDAHDASAMSEAELGRNRARLLAQLGAALGAAAPLINLDSGLLGLVHPGSAQVSPKLHLSAVPLEAHPIESELRALLAHAELQDEDINAVLNSDASVSHIDITSSLPAPVSVLAVESLLRPIAERWHQCDTPILRSNFWSRRRAQTLEAFVPVPQALLRCLARGWYTGRMLGLIARKGESFEVYSPDKRAPVPFPPHFLSTPRAPGEVDMLALVLEALALAYVEVCRTGTLDSLVAYQVLRDLGRSGPGHALYSYSWLNPALEEWIERGSTPAEALATPLLSVEPTAAVTAQQSHDLTEPRGRAASVADFCNQTRATYQHLFDENGRECEAEPATMSRSPHWIGLWVRHLGPALNDLAVAAATRSERNGEQRAPLM